MRVLNVPIGLAPFREQDKEEAGIYDVVNIMEKRANDFICEGEFDLEQYARCLLHKIITLNKSSIKPFLQQQCLLLEDPFVWLNKLEKLIDLNRDVFNTKEQNIKIEKALVVIELLRQEVEITKKGKYDFNKVKHCLKTFLNVEEQLCYLMELKTEYLQNKPSLIDTNEVSFDQKINLEIDLIKGRSKIKNRKQKVKNLPGEEKSLRGRDKLKINTNVNQFVDLFYQLSQEKKVDGKPYLEAGATDIAELIAERFKDKDGRDIPIATIKTVLKPSRFEKRPKGDARIPI
ncbi:MAG: hypothetical protein JWO32_1663 [Bacteroidetes bacterium]|nr:hypothetical protein [Bacteroidota bacterium]